MKPSPDDATRSGELAALIEKLRALLAVPAHASDAWDVFHDELMRHPDFLPRSTPCGRAHLVDAVELALEQLSGTRFPLGALTLAHVAEFSLVHGVGAAGGNLVFIIFCEQTGRGLIGLPFLKSGKLMLLSLALADAPEAQFFQPPASC